MKVICIDNTGFENQLTINKIYMVKIPDFGGYSFINTHYTIKTDNNKEIIFLKDRFITIEEIRNNKLNQLFNENN